MSQPVITVENISKAYRIGLKEEIPDTLTGALTGLLKAPLRNFKRLRKLNTFEEGGQEPRAKSQEPENGDYSSGSQLSALSSKPPEPSDTIWALRDVSFEVNEGEVVGIIGRNGAGKSTLLKVLSRITEPTSGRAVIRGRVGSLLEVGTGFHPELTGRENVYMNGTILGMTKREIDRKFDEIVEFSGVEKFLDTPTKRYSSGMQVRLAFAVAAHLDPEILIVDEVLAVGDAEFQKKCLGKMHDVASHGRTVLFVSHNMVAMQSLCRRAIQMQNGAIFQDGDVDEVIRDYQKMCLPPTNGEYAAAGQFHGPFIRAVAMLDHEDRRTNLVPLSGRFRLEIKLNAPTPVRNPRLALSFDDMMGQPYLTVQTPVSRTAVPRIDRPCTVSCEIDNLPLPPGDYQIGVCLMDTNNILDHTQPALMITVAEGEAFGEGRGFHRGFCIAPSNWSLQPNV